MNKERNEILIHTLSVLYSLNAEIMNVREDLNDILVDEEEYYDNIPDNLKNSELAEYSNEIIGNLDELIDNIDEACNNFECGMDLLSR